MRSIRRTIPNNRLLATLARDDLDRLSPDLQPVDWPSRHAIYDVGGPIDQVYFVERGLASVVTIMADGATSEVGMIGFEGIVGASALLGAKISAQQVIVQIPGAALRMSAASCRTAFDRRPAFKALVLRFVGGFLDLSAQTAACNRLHTARQRCARWLLMASDRTQSDLLPLTQEFLGSMLGIRRTGVTAIARELQHLGLIQYHRGRVTIVDRTGLEAIACECYRVDHERFRQLL